MDIHVKKAYCFKDTAFNIGQSGKAYAYVSLITSTSKKTASGEWANGPAKFWNIVCFGEVAEYARDNINKGTKDVCAKGYLEVTEKNGKTYENLVAKDLYIFKKMDALADEDGPLPGEEGGFPSFEEEADIPF